MKRRSAPAVVLLAAALAAGCAGVAIWAAPEKTASAARTEAAERADALFWSTLHSGDYDGIPRAVTALTAAYLADPRDPVTAAHLGWLHIWRLAERARLDPAPPGITDHAVLARKYFEEAVRLRPGEARYLGFYASTLLAEGNIHKDEKLTRRGYFTLQESIRAFPEFNLFTAGYAMSGQPWDSDNYREALDNMWRNVDVCVGERADRVNPHYARFMPLETREGPRRVCWNGEIAPHNFEGFFLNFGDMLVKNGQVDAARVMYRNATLAPEYATWPYRGVLETRLRDAAANVTAFRAVRPVPGAPRIMLESRIACVGCHQR
jgi:hypothetical protein